MLQLSQLLFMNIERKPPIPFPFSALFLSLTAALSAFSSSLLPVTVSAYLSCSHHLCHLVSLFPGSPPHQVFFLLCQCSSIQGVSVCLIEADCGKSSSRLILSTYFGISGCKLHVRLHKEWWNCLDMLGLYWGPRKLQCSWKWENRTKYYVTPLLHLWSSEDLTLIWLIGINYPVVA